MAEYDPVPTDVRSRVYERDGGTCRVCGRWADVPGLHHITYRSQGGLHVVDNLVTVGWTPGHDCHSRYAHGPASRAVRAALQEVVKHDGLYATQLLRWALRQERA